MIRGFSLVGPNAAWIITTELSDSTELVERPVEVSFLQHFLKPSNRRLACLRCKKQNCIGVLYTASHSVRYVLRIWIVKIGQRKLKSYKRICPSLVFFSQKSQNIVLLTSSFYHNIPMKFFRQIPSNLFFLSNSKTIQQFLAFFSIFSLSSVQ